MEQIKLDEQKLQEMAQQYAMQGAEKASRTSTLATTARL